MMALGTSGTEGGKLGGKHGGCYFPMFLEGYAQVPPPSVPSVHNLFARPRGSAVAGSLLPFLYSSSSEESEGRRKRAANPSSAEVFVPSDHVALGFGDGGSAAGLLGHREGERPPISPSCLLKKGRERRQNRPANDELAGLLPQTSPLPTISAAMHQLRR